MADPYDNPMNIPPDPFESGYGMYDNQFPGSGISRSTGPSTAFDGTAFWYRPEQQEPLYHRDSAMGFAQGGIPTQTSQAESQSGIKHRRTRSGCFTCRSRRVKCDETRPICDRCRKGNRDCEYPNSTSSKRSKQSESRTSKTDAGDDDSKLDTIRDESDDDEEEEEAEPDCADEPSPKNKSSHAKLPKSRKKSVAISSHSQKQRKSSSSSAITRERASSPSTEASGVISGPHTPLSSTMAFGQVSATRTLLSNRWKSIKPDLKPEMEMYLHFQNEHLTYYHYFFKLDPSDFIHTELIEEALQFEPLLYAVVGFAAYHYTIRLPEDGAQFSSFWKYYCKSIISLRRWLEKHTERTDAVLLTVLQLATFEEYLGDWPNIAIHHRAAHSILTTLYTPDTIMQTQLSRRIFDWYGRFDVITGIMAVRDASLGREWLATAQAWYQQHRESDHLKSEAILEAFIHDLRLVGFDMAHVFAQARSQADQILHGNRDVREAIDAIMTEIEAITQRLLGLRQEIEQLNDSNLARAVSPLSATATEEDVFDPNIPLFRDHLWPLNFVWIDWYGIELIHKYQTFVFLQKAAQIQMEQRDSQSSQGSTNESVRLSSAAAAHLSVPPELSKLAAIQCQIYEAIDRCKEAPEGAILACHASLGLSTVFLPRPPPESSQGYVMWARRKLAQVEQLGYIWPPHFRKQMSQLWGIEEIMDWWLPNGQGKTKILEEIRTVVEDRNKAAVEHMERTGKDDGRAGLREIRALFQKLELSNTGLSSDPNRRSTFPATYYRSSISDPSEPESLSGTSSGTGLSPGVDNSTEAHLVRSQGASGRRGSRQPVGTDSSSTVSAIGRVPTGSSGNWSAADRMSGIWENQEPPS